MTGNPALSLSIDLKAVAANYRIISSHLAEGATAAAVVKDDAYGLGMTECSRVLHQEGCRFFFVATLDEALAFRNNFPDWSVAVLHGFGGAQTSATGKVYIQNNLIPVLNTLHEVHLWQSAAADAESVQPAILHLDTGMHRLGLSPEEFRQFEQQRSGFSAIRFLYVMSHLACADEPEHALNETQWQNFYHTKTQLRDLPGCFANSAGIFYDPKFHFDLVRPGAALYGLQVSPRQPEMQPCIFLTAPILQIQNLKKGDAVGYGATWHSASDQTVLATIPLGYAHGYLRSCSSRENGNAFVYCHGIKCPVVGRVSMDLVTVDITAAAEQTKCGDMVEILGRHQTADTLAADAGTIGYEILTGLGKVAPRRYNEI
ncbi:MAG: alanine racemase [Alphaproteobacteria bacterium]|nr:MAG: alanine racemase [Alphaproteobacteria bacterium]